MAIYSSTTSTSHWRKWVYENVGDTALLIAKGELAGHYSVQKFGRNTDVDTAFEDIWEGGATWVAPTTARVHQIVSTSTSDTAAGAGARTVKIYGLTSWSAKEVSETITMNGTTDVPTTNSYVIIHRMKVTTKGATDVNVGTITATADTDATVTAQINPSFGQSQMAIYGVPSTQVAYVTRLYSNVLKASGAAEVDNRLLVNPEPDAELTNFVVKHTFVSSDTASNVQVQLASYKKFEGPCIIKIASDASVVNTDIGAGFDLIVVDN